MSEIKIAVAGTGYVGLVAGVCFAEKGHQVTCVDVDEKKIALMRDGVSPIFEPGLSELMAKNHAEGRLHYTTDYKSAYSEADAIFIGVGTPELPDGAADLSYLAIVARQIAESVIKDCLVVVKSTVPVGTNDKVEQFIRDFQKNDVRIDVASNPEFLAQGTAVRDTLHAARIIIGTETEAARNLLMKIYEPFDLPVISVNRRTAEMIKYACNDFLALKISYMNEIANLCEAFGANVEDIARAMAYDRRIGDKFLNPGVGYGGSCFPKDTKALLHAAKQCGIELKTVRAAVEVNQAQKTILFRKAASRMITFNGLRVAVLGLTFKPGTDDFREAPSLENIPLLVKEKADIVAYDPVGEEKFKKIHPEISYASTPEEALAGASICFIFTEWSEIRNLRPWTCRNLMRVPLVYDGRNIFSPSEMKGAGVEYYSVGRSEK